MKKLKPLAFLFAGILLSHCAVKNIAAFDMPPDLSDEDKKEFVTRFNHGFKLYKINCEQCHSKSQQGQDHGPDFTQAQIKSYEISLRMQTQKHQFIQKMNGDDIDDIIVFLKYQKVK